MQALVVVNPTAGRGNGLRVWRRLEGQIRGRSGYETVIPSSREESRRLVQEAVQAGYDRVIGVGGDGTINLIAAELVGTQTALGAVRAGTGNDFWPNYGLPQRPEEALAVALGDHTRQVDLVVLPDRRCVINAAGLGFDGAVAAAVAAMGRTKGLGGTLPYLLAAVQTLLTFRPPMAELTLDGVRHAQPAVLVSVANGYRYGGGMRIAPPALVDDGQLDICLAGDLSRWELLLMLGRVYSGKHVLHPKVRMLRGSRVQIRMPAGTLGHLDGEPTPGEELEFRVHERGLKLLSPKNEA